MSGAVWDLTFSLIAAASLFSLTVCAAVGIVAVFIWALANIRRQLQQLDDDPVIFEDPDDRAVRERAINDTLTHLDRWDTGDAAWLHPSHGLTETQIQQAWTQIHADILRVERGEPVE